MSRALRIREFPNVGALLNTKQARICFTANQPFRAPKHNFPIPRRRYHQTREMSTVGSTNKHLPKGWTDDKITLEDQPFPAVEYELEGTTRVLLFNKPESTYLVQCGDNFYLWNDVSDGVERIDKPNTFEEICKILPDLSKLKVTRL